VFSNQEYQAHFFFVVEGGRHSKEPFLVVERPKHNIRQFYQGENAKAPAVSEWKPAKNGRFLSGKPPKTSKWTFLKCNGLKHKWPKPDGHF